MYAGIWFITTDIDVLWIFCTAEFCHDIFRKIDQDRAGAAGSCDFFFNVTAAAEIYTVADSDSVFCNATCNADNVDFLKSIISDQMTCNLSGKTDKRYTVVIGSSKSGDKVGCARTAGYQTDTDLSCSSCVSICFMDKCLFMTRQDDVNAALTI